MIVIFLHKIAQVLTRKFQKNCCFFLSYFWPFLEFSNTHNFDFILFDSMHWLFYHCNITYYILAYFCLVYILLNLVSARIMSTGKVFLIHWQLISLLHNIRLVGTGVGIWNLVVERPDVQSLCCIQPYLIEYIILYKAKFSTISAGLWMRIGVRITFDYLNQNGNSP